MRSKTKQRERNKTYYAANTEKERARAKKWAADNRERSRANARRRYANNKEKVTADNVRWQKANPELYARIHYQALLKQRCKKFGITVEDYFTMLANQRGRCLICDRDENENGKDLAIDHNHKTGKVRGLLCHHCNTALGHLHEDIRVMRKMIDYVKGS